MVDLPGEDPCPLTFGLNDEGRLLSIERSRDARVNPDLELAVGAPDSFAIDGDLVLATRCVGTRLRAIMLVDRHR